MDHWLLCVCFPPWSLALLRVVSEGQELCS